MREERSMKCCPVRWLLASALWAVVFTCDVHATVYGLYYLGGQSNMDGHGSVEDLPTDLLGTVSGVMIFHGNTSPDGAPVDGRGVWSELRPGHGVGYSSDGTTATYSDPWHYDSAGYIDLGARFAEAIFGLQSCGAITQHWTVGE
jgi:hypothetical protein